MKVKMIKLNGTKFAMLVLATVFISACGGGGSGSGNSGSSGGTAGVISLKAGALDGKFNCVGGTYSLGFIIKGTCTDNQLIQGTCARTVTITADKYYDYPGATASALLLDVGIIQGPDTKPYYYGKTTFGDRLVYERYLPVLRPGTKIGVAITAFSVYDTSGTEYSLDGSKNLVVTSYSPKSLPTNLTYTSASGGPGQIESTTNTCIRTN